MLFSEILEDNNHISITHYVAQANMERHALYALYLETGYRE